MATAEQLKAIRACVTSATRDAPTALPVFQVLLTELAIIEEELNALSASLQVDGVLQLVNGLQACLYEGITHPTANIH
jgi:hypothetical protein